MKKFNLLLFILLLIFSCKPEPQEDMPDPNPEVGTLTPTGNEQYLNLTSDYIFDQAKLPTFELNLPQSELDKINNDPAAEEYVEGSLTFEGETISPVGIRYKGSIGAFVNCLSGPNFFDPSGYKTCTKLSMKIKINWEGREEKFYGLKKLQFHSQNNDDSQMRDRLAYWLFREMGVPAPRAVHARLMINGEYSGLYSLVEQIDGRFTRYNFADGKGNLYKEVWPLQMNGMPQSEQTYLNNLKTNEDENPSVQMIQNFAQQIADADDDNLQTVISDWMNLNEIISYTVVDRTIRVDDGAFHWYCDDDGNCTNHNYYWYENNADGTMHLIPWDMDNTFENIIFNSNPVTPIANDWGEISANCNPFVSGLFGLEQWSAACDKLTGGWASFENEFEQIKTQFVSGPLSEENVNQQLDAWTDQIRAATDEATQIHGDAISISAWESAIEELKTQVKFAREN